MTFRGCCSFYPKLFVGESIKNPRLVKWKLKHGAGQLFIHVITDSEFSDGQLEIQHCAFLKQKYYLRHPKYVYGIAGSYKEALDIVIRISDEAAGQGMEGDIKGYLQSLLGDN